MATFFFEERIVDFDAQTAKAYELIGQYVVAFEGCCQSIRSFISLLLSYQGLANQKLCDVLMSHMTAKTLGDCLVALLHDCRPLNSDEALVVGEFGSSFQKLYSQRNNLLHASWFIGGNAFDHVPLISLVKNKTTRKGLEHGHQNLSLQGLEEYVSNTKVLHDYIGLMQAYFLTKLYFSSNEEGPTDLRKFFIISDDRGAKKVKINKSALPRKTLDLHEVYGTQLNRSTGVKGSIERELILIARNSNDHWYFIFDDHSECTWAYTGFQALCSLIPDKLGDIPRGSILAKQRVRWKRFECDWMPDPEKLVPNHILNFRRL